MSGQIKYFRDASGRLTHSRSDIDSLLYPAVCKKLMEKFQLRASSELIVGLDEMFQDFTDGNAVVELAWDVWSCFMVTAKEPSAEALVQNLSEFLVQAVPSDLAAK